METKSRSTLKIALVIISSLLSLPFILGIVFYLNYTSIYSYGNKMENKLKAIVENNENIYAQGTQKILEVAQVPRLFKNDYKEIIIADIQGRYGKEGSSAQVQFLKEHAVNLDPSLYKKIQQLTESFRNDFQNNQTALIDVKRSYQTELGNDYFLGKGWWLRLAGFPRIDLDKFKPITTTNAEKVFKDGKEDGPLNLDINGK